MTIEINNETIQDAIRLAKRYVKDRRLPDAAIDLADHAMAALSAGKRYRYAGSGTEMKAVFDEMKKEGEKHAEDDWKWHYSQLRNKISPILWAAVQSENDPMQMSEAGEIINYLNVGIRHIITNGHRRPANT